MRGLFVSLAVAMLGAACASSAPPPPDPPPPSPAASATASASVPAWAAASVKPPESPFETGPCAGERLVLPELTKCRCHDVGEGIGLGSGPRVRCPNGVPDVELRVEAKAPAKVRAGEPFEVELAIVNAGTTPALFRATDALGTGAGSGPWPVLLDDKGAPVDRVRDPSCGPPGPFDVFGGAGTGSGGTNVGVTLPPGGRLVRTWTVRTVHDVLAPAAVQPPPPRLRPGMKRRPPRDPRPLCETTEKPLPPGNYVVEVTPPLAPDELTARVGKARAALQITD